MTAMMSIRKFDHLEPPDTSSLELLHEKACAHVEEQFKLKGGLPPTWIIGAGPHICWVETDWENGQDKQYAAHKIKQLLNGTFAGFYTFITEAWVAAFTPENMPDEEERKKLEKQAMDHGVSSLPEKFRDDVVMVNSFARSGEFSVTRYKVNMRSRGPNTLSIRVDVKDDGKYQGRMWNLFKEGT